MTNVHKDLSYKQMPEACPPDWRPSLSKYYTKADGWCSRRREYLRDGVIKRSGRKKRSTESRERSASAKRHASEERHERSASARRHASEERHERSASARRHASEERHRLSAERRNVVEKLGMFEGHEILRDTKTQRIYYMRNGRKHFQKDWDSQTLKKYRSMRR